MNATPLPPPSYDDAGVSAPPASDVKEKEQPPAYNDDESQSAATSSPPKKSSWEPLAPEPRPTLVLDGCQIYSLTHQTRPLYELSAAPAEAYFSIYRLEKVVYKTRGNDVRAWRNTHCYDFKTEESIRKQGFWLKVDIIGKRSPETTVKEATMERAGPGQLSIGCWKIANEKLSVAPASLLSLSSDSASLNWELEGKMIAVETRGTRDAHAKMVVMPRLEIVHEGLSEKHMDLLVAAWCARIMKETEKSRDPDEGKRERCKFSLQSTLQVPCSISAMEIQILMTGNGAM
jgi:hypothetical protein